MLIDTLYFTSTLPLSFSDLIITPLNSLRFNLSVSNLELHGLHPWYLHILVNWPMLFGVCLIGVVEGLSNFWRGKGENGEKERPAGEELMNRGLFSISFGLAYIITTRY
jgi:dipeptide/tripeptide permease